MSARIVVKLSTSRHQNVYVNGDEIDISDFNGQKLHPSYTQICYCSSNGAYCKAEYLWQFISTKK